MITVRDVRKLCVKWDDVFGLGATYFLIPTHYNNSLKSYTELVALAKADFPLLRKIDAKCSIIVGSSSYDRHPVVYFSVAGRINRKYARHTSNLDFKPA